MSCGQGQNSHHPLAGKRFVLIAMGDDPHPVPPGSEGVVRSAVDVDGGLRTHLNVDWDPEVGRSLNLILPEDAVSWIDHDQEELL